MSVTMLHIQRITLSIFVAALALSSGPAWAANCSVDTQCQHCGAQINRLKCKFDRMTIENKKMLDNMETLPDLTSAQRHGIGKAKDRMDREKNRRDKDSFKLLTKKRTAQCQLIEYTGNGDGACDPATEQCMEVLDDGIGDDIQPCSPMKGKKREVCAKICDDEAVTRDATALDDNTAAELEDLYDTLTAHVEEANETIPETAALARSVSENRAISVESDDPCSYQPANERHTYEAYKKARWASVGAHAAADVAERFCDVTISTFFVGFSGSATCAAVEGVTLAMDIWWDTVELVESSLDAANLDAMIACASSAASAADQTSLMIDSVQDMLDEVDARNAQIFRLLIQPPGLREGYPTP